MASSLTRWRLVRVAQAAGSWLAELNMGHMPWFSKLAGFLLRSSLYSLVLPLLHVISATGFSPGIAGLTGGEFFLTESECA